MTNELIFFSYLGIVSTGALGALALGREALVTFVCLQWVLSNLFVTKQILLFGLNVTASDALAVGASLGLNLIQEYFGKELAKETIIIGFCSTLFYTLLSLLQILYCPSPSDNAHVHFCALLTPMPRIIAASLCSYLVVQSIDYRLYGWLKTGRHDMGLIWRNYITIGATQALDTILFSFLGLYGTLFPLTPLIVMSYSIKVAVIACAVPFVAFSHLILKK